ncbi:MAG: hypothetical protein AUJ55_10555 [Proteobacteria bacterium CG1_02_64_396]|nr:MAG: hypothetical protein AUJ55_10555 [Proteobacteria bacterium CG1_02_64_396]
MKKRSKGNNSRSRPGQPFWLSAKVVLPVFGLLLLAAVLAMPSLNTGGRHIEKEVRHTDSTVQAPPVSGMRTVFTTAIKDREPVDRVSTFSAKSGQATFFSEVRNLDGHTVTHQWRWGDKVMFEIPFKIKGERWRVWSTKTLLPQWQGVWSVWVVDETGQVLARDTLNVKP